MAEEYIKELYRWFVKVNAEHQVDHYLELFPELHGRLFKFGIGIFQWDMGGEINIEKTDDVRRVRMILKVLESSPAFDFYDHSFNGCSPEIVCRTLGMSPIANKKEDSEIKYNYSILPVTRYEDINEFKDAISWCIVISKTAYEEFTKKGNRFCFLVNRDWIDCPSIPGRNFPYDKYGYSLIAVEISPQNEIVSVTSRWNECCENSGKFLSETQLKKILGKNFYKL